MAPQRKASGSDRTMEFDGTRVNVSNLDKVLYPASGTTKGDVIDYYAAVASTMIPHVAHRIVTRKRWPNGVEESSFFEKNLGSGTPDWVPQRTRQHRDREVRYPLVESVATLVWLAQLAALELHVPQWMVGPRGKQHPPDRLVLDLDPGPGVGLSECVAVAKKVREVLGDSGAGLVPVTSGSKGLHLYLGLGGDMSSDDASQWARALAQTVQRAMPDLVVARMARVERKGKVFIDWSQNNAAKTTVAPYSLRGRERPWVAAPRTWEELDDPKLAQLELRDVLRRIDEIGDPMAELGQPVDGDPGTGGDDADADDEDDDEADGDEDDHDDPDEDDEDDGDGHADGVAEDSLAAYRAKRRADRTPEPVPDRPIARVTGREARSGSAGSARSVGPRTFVIHEHHARRLHWDLRLEHDGVLVSWAVPKGMPNGKDGLRLAVRTEDHPMEYGKFEGTIPKGEYGAGTVTIWDSGEYRTEKWRPDEIIVVFSGSRTNGRYVLVRTGSEGDAERGGARDQDGHTQRRGSGANQWLLKRMKDQSGVDVGSVTDGATSPKPRRQKRLNNGGTSDADVTMPRDLRPMLATLATTEDMSGDGWQFEAKWDGVRVIAEIADGDVRAHGRSGKDITATYPELTELTDALRGHTAVVDGEIVALKDNGAPSFPLLQRRLGLTEPREVESAAGEVEAYFYLFDLLYLDGVDLRGKTLRDRRRLLERLAINTEHCSVPEILKGPATDALKASEKRHLEGIVGKRVDSRYRDGKRPGTWLKAKLHATQDVVVVGWRPGRGRRSGGIGSLLVALPVDPAAGDGAPAENSGSSTADRGELVYAGRVGTGFTDASLQHLHAQLKPLQRKTSPVHDSVPRADARDAVWVTPKLVGEVEFTEFTDDGRFRHPSWRGLREDIAVDDVAPVHR